MTPFLIGYVIYSVCLMYGVICWLAWSDYKHGPDHKFGYSLRYNRGYPYFLGIPPTTWIMLLFTLPIINIFSTFAVLGYILKFVVLKKWWGDKE